MSGHTRFATLLCLEIDGIRVAHTGDQVFFGTPDGSAFGPGARPVTNYVYKNGSGTKLLSAPPSPSTRSTSR